MQSREQQITSEVSQNLDRAEKTLTGTRKELSIHEERLSAILQLRNVLPLVEHDYTFIHAVSPTRDEFDEMLLSDNLRNNAYNQLIPLYESKIAQLKADILNQERLVSTLRKRRGPPQVKEPIHKRARIRASEEGPILGNIPSSLPGPEVIMRREEEFGGFPETRVARVSQPLTTRIPAATRPQIITVEADPYQEGIDLVGKINNANTMTEKILLIDQFLNLPTPPFRNEMQRAEWIDHVRFFRKAQAMLLILPQFIEMLGTSKDNQQLVDIFNGDAFIFDPADTEQIQSLRDELNDYMTAKEPTPPPSPATPSNVPPLRENIVSKKTPKRKRVYEKGAKKPAKKALQPEPEEGEGEVEQAGELQSFADDPCYQNMKKVLLNGVSSIPFLFFLSFFFRSLLVS